MRLRELEESSGNSVEAEGDWLISTPEVELRLAQDQFFLDITEAIAEAMERRNVTRADLARLVNVSRSAISQRLSGETNMTIKTVAETLHQLNFGIQVGLVDKLNGCATTVLHDHEWEDHLQNAEFWTDDDAVVSLEEWKQQNRASKDEEVARVAWAE